MFIFEMNVLIFDLSEVVGLYNFFKWTKITYYWHLI